VDTHKAFAPTETPAAQRQPAHAAGRCADHQLMSTSAKTTPWPLTSSMPWLGGTLIVTGGSTLGCSLSWYGLAPVLLNCARIVASYSPSD